MISKAIRCCSLYACFLITGCTTAPWTTKADLATLQDEISKQREEAGALHAKLDGLAEQQQALITAYEEHKAILEQQAEEAPPVIVSESTPIAEPAAQVVAPPAPSVQAETEHSKVWVGREENIFFPALDKSFAARIDTGAESSSIDARELTRFERDGKKWVRFTIYAGEEQLKVLERPVVRWVRVFQSTDADGERRPVVQLAFRIGDIEDMADFTLTDRAHLDYSVLVGRNVLNDLMVVDVSQSFILSK